MLLLRCNCVNLAPRMRFLSTTASPITLRPYQEHCINSCLHALDNGTSRIGVSLPTGSGKTTVFITLLNRLRVSKANATRSLVIVNSIELARQSASTAKHLYPEWSVEIEQGAKHNASGLADLTVATYQTLLNPARFEKFDPQFFKAVIVDEAHHAAAPSYRRLLGRFHNAIRPPIADEEQPEHEHAVPILGFSATFNRHDSLALSTVFEHIAYHRDFLEMIEEEWLCGVRVTSVSVALDLDKVAVSPQTGDFKGTSLAEVINTPSMNETLVKVWLERAAPSRKSTLVFCVTLDHVRDLTNVFRRYGVDARYIHSLTPSSERKEIVRAFKAGEFPVLVNCAVLTEGADIPNIDCVLLAKPTRSRNVYMQMIGRGMRLSPNTGKEDCLLIDFADSANRVSDIMSLPTLLGIDASELDRENLTLDELKAHAKVMKEKLTPVAKPSNRDIATAKSVTFVDHGSILDCFKTPKKNDFRSISPLAWVRCGSSLFVLECLGQGTMRIQGHKNGDSYSYEGHYSRKDRPTRTVLKADTMQDAFRAADQYVQKVFGSYDHIPRLFRNAAWRKIPASPAQLSIITNKLKKSISTGTDAPLKMLISSCLHPSRRSKEISEESLEGLTKGEACSVLCKLINGGLRFCQYQVKAQLDTQKLVEKQAAQKSKLDARANPPLLFGTPFNDSKVSVQSA